jgi:hypothetical protein
MKAITLTSVFLAFTLAASATVWRVNNRDDASAAFTTLQLAHNHASVLNGDTLYLEGSPTSYGNLTLTKRLHIIGAGFFLSENDSTRAYKENSLVGNVTFNNGSQNSVIEGVYFNATGVTINVSDITIRRNRFNYNTGGVYQAFRFINIGAGQNILIEGNYMYNFSSHVSSVHGCIYSAAANLTNLVIMNNYLYTATSAGSNTIFLQGTVFADNVIVKHNVIQGNVWVKEIQYYNNIQISGNFVSNSSYFSNNIGSSTQYGTNNGNQQNVSMANVFVNHTNNLDNGLILKVGSPALGAGLFSEDCGMFGGDNPYKMSGIPAIPAIWEVNITNSYGNDNSPINVTIKAKSNN